MLALAEEASGGSGSDTSGSGGGAGAGSAAAAPAAPSATATAAAAAVQSRLAAEVLRKLRLATQAEDKDDRDIVCAEVFADVTGELNAAAKDSTGALYRRWYEALAPHFCRSWEASEALLALCRQLWGQPFAAPTFALLLHQWLLVHPQAGGADQRLKHLNVLCSGARQLFLGDVETGRTAFQPLYTFIAEQVVLSPDQRRLDALPQPGRESIMALAASFLPYYCSREAFLVHLGEFPSPHHTLEAGGHLAGEGADFAVDRITDTLSKEIRTEQGLLRSLRMLMALRGRPHLALLSTATRVRLQGEVYLLSQPGGPRYAPRRVNKLAGEALDQLFPAGRRTRHLINLGFRFLHPQEWPWYWWDFCSRAARAAAAWLWAAWLALAAAAAWLAAPAARLRLRRPPGLHSGFRWPAWMQRGLEWPAWAQLRWRRPAWAQQWRHPAR
ncbi:K(+)-stimulated pyrophosphate-energized sodium pump [Micractinium conductrix]|uniref:K(+)-stimulated pyrophosphate-energized sodium pump n=1 Tax=Micractinium conductrix TaxID=554055 RepID=A0A2P6VH78_9CHLO|nr:K(+)-stimulated pyrophosphate-energized sodium pump [Micractinium conductrix]|eukprot:PSC73443.1 K(+)-stimulated pyrophosphate-energized sodium pump [Micractinium conductrix]